MSPKEHGADTQENVEPVRAICAPWERGDFHDVEWADPQIEFGFALEAVGLKDRHG